MSAIIQTLYATNEYSSSGITEHKCLVLSSGDSIYRPFYIPGDQNWNAIRLGFKMTMLNSTGSTNTLVTHSNFFAGFCSNGLPIIIDPLTDNTVAGHGAGIQCRTAGSPFAWNAVTNATYAPAPNTNIAWGNSYAQCCAISGANRVYSPTGATIAGWNFARYEASVSASHPYSNTLIYPWISYAIDIQREGGGHNIGCTGASTPGTDLTKGSLLHNIPRTVYRAGLEIPAVSPGTYCATIWDSYFTSFNFGLLGTFYTQGAAWTRTSNGPQMVLSESVHGPLSCVNFAYFNPHKFSTVKIAIRDIVVVLLKY